MTGRRILLWTAAVVACIFTTGVLMSSNIWGLIPFVPALVAVTDMGYQWVLRIRLRMQIRTYRNG